MGVDIRARLVRFLLRPVRPAIAALLALAAAAPAHAVVSVFYQAVDLTDTVAGQDRWRYDYTVQGALTAFDTLTIEFAPGRYSQLVLTAAPSRLQALPIVTGLPGTSSLFQLTATSTASALTDRTSVSFVWSGSGAPGAQVFSVVSDAGTLLQTGTVAPVPEPAAWALLLAGLAPVVAARRRHALRAAPPH